MDKSSKIGIILEEIWLVLFICFEDTTASEDKKGLSVFSAIAVVCCIIQSNLETNHNRKSKPIVNDLIKIWPLKRKCNKNGTVVQICTNIYSKRRRTRSGGCNSLADKTSSSPGSPGCHEEETGSLSPDTGFKKRRQPSGKDTKE